MNRDPSEGPHPKPIQQEIVGQKLAHEQMREKLRDPSFLPSYSELAPYFYGPERSNDLEQVKWSKFFHDNEHQVFEVWAKEYIHALGNYLTQRVAELGGTEKTPVIILEIGAGDGRLTHFLQKELNELIPGRVTMIASDSNDLKIPPAFPVENLPHDEALKKYTPQIVISSWMPARVDFTAAIRATKSVDEYILIGEADGGCCGADWETWGLNLPGDDDEKYEQRRHQKPPYKADGFEKNYHNDLKKLQLSRSSFSDESSWRSKTVSFKKIKTPHQI